MRLRRLAKLQRAAASITESFRGVDLSAFSSLKQAISYIESARNSERVRLMSRQNRKNKAVNIRQLLGI